MTQVVGRSTPRVEGMLKVTGKAHYSGDFNLPGTLWGRCLRSPIAHGRIKSIDVSKALTVPGVKAVITGEDVPGLRIGRCIYDTPVMADGLVRFIGEKVAAVAAETKLAAEQALELIEVEYEEMAPLLDPVEATKDSAPVLHPDLLSYKGLPVPVEKLGNVFAYLKWGKGDIEAGFREADLIVENTFTTQVTHQSYLEPHACVVQTPRRRQRGYLVMQQDAVRRARPTFQLHRLAKRKAGFSSHADRRRFRRQGRIHGCAGRLFSLEEERPAGENDHGLHRGADCRQPAPRFDH